MKVKTEAPKEDPETKAKRMVEEARAEADKTSALQGLLDRRQRRVMRIFGKPDSAGATGPGAGTGSGASGVIAATPSSSVSTFGGSAQERLAAKFGRSDYGIYY